MSNELTVKATLIDIDYGFVFKCMPSFFGYFLSFKVKDKEFINKLQKLGCQVELLLSDDSLEIGFLAGAKQSDKVAQTELLFDSIMFLKSLKIDTFKDLIGKEAEIFVILSPDNKCIGLTHLPGLSYLNWTEKHKSLFKNDDEEKIDII